MSANIFRIAVEGFGGQGVLTLGHILGLMLGKSYKHVSVSPSYTAEMFGGACYCYVTASNEAFQNPIPEKIDFGISTSGKLGDVLSRSLQGGSTVFIAHMSRVLLTILFKRTLDDPEQEILKANRRPDIPPNIYLFILAARHLGATDDLIRQSLQEGFPNEVGLKYADFMTSLERTR